jgi:predicted DNA-binding transcriptional regulator AlpA
MGRLSRLFVANGGPMTTDDDAILDVQAAARLVGLSVATLAKMRCMGGGPPFLKLGRRVLYRRADIKAWLDARRVRNTTEAIHKVPRRLTDNSASSPNPPK